MGILISVPEVLNHLLTHGIVYTFRLYSRVVGNDWVRDERLGKKIATVNVELVMETNASSNLSDFVENSGFPDHASWLEKIRFLYPKMDFDKFHGYLFKVVLKEITNPKYQAHPIMDEKRRRKT